MGFVVWVILSTDKFDKPIKEGIGWSETQSYFFHMVEVSAILVVSNSLFLYLNRGKKRDFTYNDMFCGWDGD